MNLLRGHGVRSPWAGRRIIWMRCGRMSRVGVAFLLMLSMFPSPYYCQRQWLTCLCSWADGWRGFIDGAFEMGRSSAWRVLKEERDAKRTSKL